MSETFEPNNLKTSQDKPQETAGDILHKERVTRRITLETIAKDLKLNVRYIKAIESNNLKELPAEPYIRVYIRSIATYLMLDPDEILQRFFKERGIRTEVDEREGVERIKIQVNKDTESRSMTWIIITIVILILVALSYVANKKGWMTSVSSEQKTLTTFEDSSVVEDTFDEYSDSLFDVDEDTVSFDQQENIDSLLLSNSSVSEDAAVSEISSPKKSNLLKLVVAALKDSVWIQVYRDGKSWRNFIKHTNPRSFYARDSLNLLVGDNSLASYHLNGKALTIKGSGVTAFKINHSGIEMWQKQHWDSVFSDRM